MAYVVVVFAIINSAVFIAVWLAFVALREDLLTSVGTVIEDEVRRQDDRIEKRVAKQQGKPGNDEEVLALPADGRMEVGRPYRR